MSNLRKFFDLQVTEPFTQNTFLPLKMLDNSIFNNKAESQDVCVFFLLFSFMSCSPAKCGAMDKLIELIYWYFSKSCVHTLFLNHNLLVIFQKGLYV